MLKRYLPYRLILLIVAGLLSQIVLQGQLRTYSHPTVDFGFRASPDWELQFHSENGQVFHAVNPNKNMQVYLSFIPQCKNPVKQLEQISGETGLICSGKPYDTIINNRKAFLLKGTCVQGRKPLKRMVIGIPGMHGLYVMEICCPEECYVNHREDIYSLLGTVHAGI
jgi:hypothetical protein